MFEKAEAAERSEVVFVEIAPVVTEYKGAFQDFGRGPRSFGIVGVLKQLRYDVTWRLNLPEKRVPGSG